MDQLVNIKNWQLGSSPAVLDAIHQDEINIVIQNRSVSTLSEEIEKLQNERFELRVSGNMDTILAKVRNCLGTEEYGLLIADIEKVLLRFQEVSESSSFRLMLATVESDMCRRFHTDINDVRLLCTYSGPGTLWLTEDNVNRVALNSSKDNEDIVIDESAIRQAGTGDIVLLKGAIYPKEGTLAVVHRSPSIEEYDKKRLLLRIDSDGLFNF